MKTKRLHHIYRNLHTGTWSLRKRGIVQRRPRSLVLENVEFRVGETGRQRVLRERVKNVHAYAAGESALIGADGIPTEGMVRVSYNPYRGGSFFEVATGRDLEGAQTVIACADGKTLLASGLRYATR